MLGYNQTDPVTEEPKKKGNPLMVKGGPSLNPAGRPRGSTSLSDLARRRVNKDELLDIFMAIARGEPLVKTLDTVTGAPMPASKAPEGAQVTEVIWPSTAERLRAAEFLWEKIEPPVKQSKVTVEVGGAGGGADFKQLSDEELDQYLALQEKARKKVEDAEDAELVEGGGLALPAGDPEPTK